MRRESNCLDPRECRVCKALILWVRFRRSGKSAPVDVAPSPTGDLLLSYNKNANTLTADKIHDAAPPGRNRYTCHWATCPPDRKTSDTQQSFPEDP